MTALPPSAIPPSHTSSLAHASTLPVALAVTGASGRMGKRIIAIAVSEQGDKFKLVGALDRPDSAFLAQDAGLVAGVGDTNVLISSNILGGPQVAIDFSAPAATRKLIAECVSRGIGMVVGTTGLTADDQRLIDEAAKSIAILQATNTSLGVNVLMNIVAQVARQLGEDYDIEIVEAHHNQKKDAPSGTALSLAESIVRATGKSMERDLVYGRHGHETMRQKGTIGVHAVRMGDVVGDHTVYYATTGERVEIRHVATSRDTFARGALRAAYFIARQSPGRYTMANVLGL